MERGFHGWIFPLHVQILNLSTNILTSNNQIFSLTNIVMAFQNHDQDHLSAIDYSHQKYMGQELDQSVMFVKLPSTLDIQPMTIELYGIKQNTNRNYQQNRLKRLELNLIYQLNWGFHRSLVSPSIIKQIYIDDYQLFYFGGLKILFILKRQEHNV